jgi:hypothetical protein
MDAFCDSIQKRLVKLHLGKKAIAEDTEVQAHLETCPACRRYRDHLDHDNREMEGVAESLDSYVHDVSEKLHRRAASPEREEISTRTWLSATVAFAVLLILVLAFTMFGPGAAADRDRPAGGVRTAMDRITSLRIPDPEGKAIEMELRLARRHLEQGNVPALLQLLDSEYDPTRIRAAQYLAQIGDRSTMAVLESRARAWDDPTVANPYAQAVAQIESRLARERAARQEETAPERPEAVTSEPIESPTESALTAAIDQDANTAVLETAPSAPASSSGATGPGSPGRTVVGRLALLGASREIAWDAMDIRMMKLPQVSDLHREPMPEGYPEMSLDALRSWYDRQRQDAETATPAWQFYPPTQEGYFHCENLPPGRYALMGHLTPDPPGDPRHQEARLWYDWTVTAEGADPFPFEAPLEIGTIDLLAGDLVPGDAAPDFNLPGLDVAWLCLDDYRGSLVLLSFYPAAVLDDLPDRLLALRDIVSDFESTAALVTIGMLASDGPVLLDQKRVELAELPWPHARVGPAGENRAHIAYDLLGVEQWPWNVLVDPDGTVLAVGLQGEELVAAIEANLP